MSQATTPERQLLLEVESNMRSVPTRTKLAATVREYATGVLAQFRAKEGFPQALNSEAFSRHGAADTTSKVFPAMVGVNIVQSNRFPDVVGAINAAIAEIQEHETAQGTDFIPADLIVRASSNPQKRTLGFELEQFYVNA